MGIQEKLLEIIKSNQAKAISVIGLAGVSYLNPITGLVLNAAHEIAGLADEMRIDALVKGLSTDIAHEKQINQLYIYVEKSEENAFYVSNTLRKAFLSDSPIACTVMGRMLASHLKEEKTYDQVDSIVFHALENATDDDILIFMQVMKENKNGEDSFRLLFNDMNDSVRTTLEWCLYNRLFREPDGAVTWQDVSDQGLYMKLKPTAAAYELYEYVESVKQIIRYA